MTLLSVSSNAKSIEYRCNECGRKTIAHAIDTDAPKAKTQVKHLEASWEQEAELFGGTIFVKKNTKYLRSKEHGRALHYANFQAIERDSTDGLPKKRRITKKTRHEVWQRDEGRCVACRSNENLEFDHIIPLSKGGSNTVRNVQLLCQPCNRKKSDSI